MKYFLEQCLFAVQKACVGIEAEILLIDNHSSDGSKAYLENKFTGVRYFWNTKNLGFGAACNAGLAEASGKYILFLNPDTLVPEDCFIKSMQFFEASKDCAAMGIRMLDGSGIFLKESKRMLPDLKASFFKMLGMAKLFPNSKIFARYYAGHISQFKNHEIDVLAGAFLLMNKNSIELTGGFDTDYFMYGEDVDLSYRIQKAGLKNYYFADASIIHFKGESAQRNSKNYIRHFYGAMHLFVKKQFDQHANNQLIHWAISGTQFVATVRLSFLQLFHKNNKKSAMRNVVAIGVDEDFDQLKKFDQQISIHAFLSIEASDKPEEIITKIEGLALQQTDTLLFVGGGLCNSTIITVMDTLKDRFQYLFHQKGSESIIGSSAKNTNGWFIVSDPQ